MRIVNDPNKYGTCDICRFGNSSKTYDLPTVTEDSIDKCLQDQTMNVCLSCRIKIAKFLETFAK